LQVDMVPDQGEEGFGPAALLSPHIRPMAY